MRELTGQTADRVGLYLKPNTRNRLNKFKSDMALVTGRSMSQDDAINTLLDHFIATSPKQAERVRELA
jgi:hypothetical protein